MWYFFVESEIFKVLVVNWTKEKTLLLDMLQLFCDTCCNGLCATCCKEIIWGFYPLDACEVFNWIILSTFSNLASKDFILLWGEFFNQLPRSKGETDQNFHQQVLILRPFTQTQKTMFEESSLFWVKATDRSCQTLFNQLFCQDRNAIMASSLKASRLGWQTLSFTNTVNLSRSEWDGRTPPLRMWCWWTSWPGSWTRWCPRQSASPWCILSSSTTRRPWNTSRGFLRRRGPDFQYKGDQKTGSRWRKSIGDRER